jgi:hypothetical protein
MNYALTAQSLAEWLNERKSGLANSQAIVAEYLQWRNAGKPKHLPEAAHRHLFARPLRLKARLRDVHGLGLVPIDNSDYGILHLIDIDRAGLVSRLRKCPHCSKWFFAKNSKKQFCLTDCQIKHWQQTVQGRAVKAAYMRKWRATKKKLWEAKYPGRSKKGRR